MRRWSRRCGIRSSGWLPLRPRFVSVTYGADGSTRERTHQVVMRVLKETSLTPAPHLTCVGADREQILEIARGYWRRRRTPHRRAARRSAAGQRRTTGRIPVASPTPSTWCAGSRAWRDFEISVAAYPEMHPEAPSRAVRSRQSQGQAAMPAPIAPSRSSSSNRNVPALSRSLRGGGHRARGWCPAFCRSRAFRRCCNFAARCGATVPEWLRHRFDGLEDDADTRRMIAAAFAIGQVETLSREGVDEFHFYTLNRADLTYAICHALGVRAPQSDPTAASADWSSRA